MKKKKNKINGANGEKHEWNGNPTNLIRSPYDWFRRESIEFRNESTKKKNNIHKSKLKRNDDSIIYSKQKKKQKYTIQLCLQH